MKTSSRTKNIIGFRVGDKRFDTLEEAKAECKHLIVKQFKKSLQEVDSFKIEEDYGWGLRHLWITFSIRLVPIYKEDEDEDGITTKFEEEILKKGLTDGDLENLSEDEILALYLKNYGV